MCKKNIQASLPMTKSKTYSMTIIIATVITTVFALTNAAFAQTRQQIQYNQDFERRLVELVNAERTKHSLPPIAAHDALTNVARAHSADMFQNNHGNSRGTDGTTNAQRVQNAGVYNSFAAQLLVSRNNSTPEEFFASWSHTWGEVILSEDYTHIGVGVVSRPQGSNARFASHWTVMFNGLFALTPEEIRAFEMQVLELTNAERANHGLAPLVWHDALADAARAHSADLMRNNMRGHTGSDGSSVRQRVERAGVANFRSLAENCHYGRRTPAGAVDGWMNSSGHRANILDPRSTHLGVGLVLRDANSNAQYMTYWTQKFAGFAPGAVTTATVASASDDDSTTAATTSSAMTSPPTTPATPTTNFTVTPNPAVRLSASGMSFFWYGQRLFPATIPIYDAAGDVVGGLEINDRATSNVRVRRRVAVWNLRDLSGRPVPAGSYQLRGVITTADGDNERVQLHLNIR